MITIKTLEQIRKHLGISISVFCSRLAIAEDNYMSFLEVDNMRNFPSRAIGNLRQIMLSMEAKNLDKYKTHKMSENIGHFHSSKILHHLDRVNELQDSSPVNVKPITVEWHLSNICNHACPSCVNSIPNRKKERKNDAWKALFDTSLIDSVIYDLKNMGVRGVVFSGGGEPLMHHQLSGTIKKLSDAGIEIGLVTNGSKLSDDGSDQLITTIVKYCSWCRISVDAGTQSGYEKSHGKTNAVDFEQLITNIERMATEKMEQHSDIVIGTSYLLTPENYSELSIAANIFQHIDGVNYFQVKPLEISPIRRGLELSGIYWDYRIFDTLIALSTYEQKDFSVYVPNYKFIDLLLSDSEGLPFSKCWGHPFYPTISADGTVLICCQMLDYVFENKTTGQYGKITKDKSFLEIWDQQKRFDIGFNIPVKACPSNCKLSETNKILEQINRKALHTNFIS